MGREIDRWVDGNSEDGERTAFVGDDRIQTTSKVGGWAEWADMAGYFDGSIRRNHFVGSNLTEIFGRAI